MEDTEIEVLLGRQMPHTGHKRPPQRPILGLLRQDFVDGRVVNGRCPIGLVRHGQALLLHPRVEHPENEVFRDYSALSTRL